MLHKQVIIFLILALVFTGVHYLAMAGSLYWYYWWFDMVMHFWGGLLIGLGLHALSTFSSFHIRPTTKTLLLILFVMTGSWEIFEWSAGLLEPKSHLLDTAKDVVLGFSGGLLAHFTLLRYRMR